MKKFAALVLALTCLGSLIGCDQQENPEQNDNGAQFYFSATVIEQNEESDWGITLSTENVTPIGMTLVCAQSGGEPTGELQCGSAYSLLVYSNGGWSAVPTLPGEVAWDEIAYLVLANSSVEFELDWEWLYGELPAGTYRIAKDFMDFRGTGDYDMQTYYADFEITG